jgi:tetratricopeptide (TPR) repeat protein
LDSLDAVNHKKLAMDGWIVILYIPNLLNKDGLITMATARKTRKKSYKEDRLVTYSVTFSRYVQEHFNQVITGLVILVAIIAILLFVNYSRRSAARDSERYLGAALALFRQGDIAAAKTSFEEIISRYSQTRAGAIASYYQGECALRLTSYPEAGRAFDVYLEKSKKFPEFITAATIGKTVALESSQRHGDAAGILVQLLETLAPDDPRYTESLFRAGMLYKKAGMTDDAIRCLTKLAEGDPGPFKEEAEIALASLRSMSEGGFSRDRSETP